MADNTSRSYRRQPLAPGASDPMARQMQADPLAELARLIGQNDPATEFDSEPAHVAADTYHDAPPAAASEWAEDDRYAEQPARADERYDAPQLADSYPRDPALPFEPAAAGQFAEAAPRFDNARGYAAADDVRYRAAPEPVDNLSRQPQAAAPDPRGVRYQYDQRQQDGLDDQDYAAEDDVEDSDQPRRGGFVFIAAVLCLAIAGTAGTFAYRAMFGGSILPTLPPIIKASDGPNKILPSAGTAQAKSPDQADANATASKEKLVSREEQPVDVQESKTAPRVISTIPIFPAPGGASPPVPSAGALTPAAPAPGAQASAGSAPAFPPAPAPNAAPALPAGTASGAAATGPKKIHTVIIRPDQMNDPDAGAASAPPASRAAAVPPPPPVRAAAPAPRPAAPAAPKQSVVSATGNAPLELVPSSQGEAPPASAHTRTALARTPTPLAVPAAGGGGYAVQVTSQRSEAEAQTAFNALRTKYPQQLGSHEAMVRRADLGAKGVYYRALVGPFASMEQAAGICSSLKAAGGNCIVQKD